MVNKQDAKMATEVKVGDIIKSLDFAGRDSCYMIGKVIALLDDGDYINCKGIARVWDGKASAGEDFGAPREGLHFLDKHYPGRITVIES
jgi:hypothetical protein